MLHAILYTHLIKGELGQAVDFIDGLIMQASVAMATSGEELPIYDDGSRPPLMTLVSHRSQVSSSEMCFPTDTRRLDAFGMVCSGFWMKF